ncbi:hypothetical protein [Ornithinimicrobium kibberense]
MPARWSCPSAAYLPPARKAGRTPGHAAGPRHRVGGRGLLDREGQVT